MFRIFSKFQDDVVIGMIQELYIYLLLRVKVRERRYPQSLRPTEWRSSVYKR